MVTFVVCIVLGLLSGFVANQMLYRNLGRPLLNFVVGAAGALIGGYFYLQVLVGPSPAGGVTFWSILVAISGAVVLLGIKHAVLGNRPVGT
jgi:uncharacterized membrane protein YeaQ/YmgE (transglycosylase-associated protein family)